MSSWVERLKALIEERGYHECMRRSFQTVLLLEAKRSVATTLQNLRPYQRKGAFMKQLEFLLDQLSDVAYPNQREEMLYRTMTSRVSIDGDVAWTRLNLIGKELAKLEEQIKPFLSPDRTHNEAVNLMVQDMYNAKQDKQGAIPPWAWEFGNNHCILAFRLYYKGDSLDPTFPPATIAPAVASAAAIVAPSSATNTPARAASALRPTHSGTPVRANMHLPTTAAAAATANVEAVEAQQDDETDTDTDSRNKLLQEVRQHLDILKEFEGVISEEEIAERKRELFRALPPAPAPPGKRGKY